MTNEQRAAAVAAANALIAQLTADKTAIADARQAVMRLADMLGQLECCVSNTISAARKVVAEPKAAIIRDLKSSEQHLEFYGRKNTRNIRSLALKAMGSDFEGAIMRADVRAATAAATAEPVTSIVCSKCHAAPPSGELNAAGICRGCHYASFPHSKALQPFEAVTRV